MGKKKSWFSAVKKFFIPEGKPKEEKNKGWKGVFGRQKIKQYPAISVPQRTLIKANKEQRKHAMAVAVATAAAAEAAVNAAHAAAEFVRLTSSPSYFGKIARNLAATTIQTSFRAYLARKALKALKGVVMLQAVIRGQNVRRVITTHLKSLQSILKPQAQVHQISVSSTDESCVYGEEKESFSPRTMFENKYNKLVCKSNKNCDYSSLTKEDKEISLQKKDAIKKRDQMKKYSFSHRERPNNLILAEFSNKDDGRRKPWFEELQDVDVAKQTEKFKATVQSNTIDIGTTGRRLHKLRNGLKGESEELLNSSISLPRRSFCTANKQEYNSIIDHTLPNYPGFPTYMAATESAKAKIRSASTPRQRHGYLDFSAVHSSLYKPRQSSWSSFDGDLAGVKGKSATSRHKSLRI